MLEMDEDCDDGNLADGDCCSSTCAFEAVSAPCTDDSACTDGDACDGAGLCVVGPPLVCDDGAFCNGAESCDPGTGCEAGVPPVVDDGISCTLDACDEVEDLITHTPDALLCDDGAFCNGAEVCDPLLDCQPGPAPVVDDGVACTLDACDEVGDVVTHTPDALVCDDGAFCNGAEECDPLLDCQPGQAPVVDDGVACTLDACDEVGDVVTHTPDAAACDDADPCTADSCDAITGCGHEPIPQCPVPVPLSGGILLQAIAFLLGTSGAWWLRESHRATKPASSPHALD